MGVWRGTAGVKADVKSDEVAFAENLWLSASLNPGVASPSLGLLAEVVGFELKKSIACLDLSQVGFMKSGGERAAGSSRRGRAGKWWIQKSG